MTGFSSAPPRRNSICVVAACQKAIRKRCNTVSPPPQKSRAQPCDFRGTPCLGHTIIEVRRIHLSPFSRMFSANWVRFSKGVALERARKLLKNHFGKSVILPRAIDYFNNFRKSKKRGFAFCKGVFERAAERKQNAEPPQGIPAAANIWFSLNSRKNFLSAQKIFREQSITDNFSASFRTLLPGAAARSRWIRSPRPRSLLRRRSSAKGR